MKIINYIETLKAKLLEYLKTKNDAIDNELYRIFSILTESNGLKIIEHSKLDNVPKDVKIRGYYSLSTNELALVVDDNTPEITEKELLDFKTTFRHELMHYIVRNRYTEYLKIWKSVHIEFYRRLFGLLYIQYGKEFDAPVSYNYKNINELYGDKYFDIFVKKYYNTIRINDLLKTRHQLTLYSNCAEYMYRNVPVEWATFVDTVLLSSIKIEVGEIEANEKILINTLYNTYISLWPSIKNHPRYLRNGYYQEVFTPSEISSMVSEGIYLNPKLYKLTLDTLKCF